MRDGVWRPVRCGATRIAVVSQSDVLQRSQTVVRVRIDVHARPTTLTIATPDRPLYPFYASIHPNPPTQLPSPPSLTFSKSSITDCSTNKYTTLTQRKHHSSQLTNNTRPRSRALTTDSPLQLDYHSFLPLCLSMQSAVSSKSDLNHTNLAARRTFSPSNPREFTPYFSYSFWRFSISSYFLLWQRHC